jgi:hypothetical protein
MRVRLIVKPDDVQEFIATAADLRAAGYVPASDLTAALARVTELEDMHRSYSLAAGDEYTKMMTELVTLRELEAWIRECGILRPTLAKLDALRSSKDSRPAVDATGLPPAGITVDGPASAVAPGVEAIKPPADAPITRAELRRVIEAGRAAGGAGISLLAMLEELDRQ